MKAGELRHRITFQTNTPTANSIGEFVNTFTTYATLWGADRPLRGSWLYQAQQANSEVVGEVEIRYNSGIVPEMRMVIGSRTLKILSIINPDHKNEKLIIQYKEVID